MAYLWKWKWKWKWASSITRYPAETKMLLIAKDGAVEVLEACVFRAAPIDVAYRCSTTDSTTLSNNTAPIHWLPMLKGAKEIVDSAFSWGRPLHNNLETLYQAASIEHLHPQSLQQKQAGQKIKG